LLELLPLLPHVELPCCTLFCCGAAPRASERMESIWLRTLSYSLRETLPSFRSFTRRYTTSSRRSSRRASSRSAVA
jgi:hypothetical protein